MNALNKGSGAGWIAEYSNEAVLMEVVQSMLASGMTKWDVFCPYPCEAARLSSMRLRLGRIRLLSLLGVIGGFLGGAVVVLWIYATQYLWGERMLNQGRVSGPDVWPGYVPVVFEGILLGAGILLLIGFLWASGLPKWYDWVSASERLSSKASTGGFFIVADSTCGDEAASVLRSHCPLGMEWVEEKGGMDE